MRCTRPSLPDPLVEPLADDERIVAMIADITGSPAETVRCKLHDAEFNFGAAVRAELLRRGIQPYVWSDDLARFYQETDAFLYELIVHNRNPPKLAMRSWIARQLRQVPHFPLDVLVFGDGLGFDSLHLAQAGHRVSYFEVSELSRRFATRIFAAAGAAIRMPDRAEDLGTASYDAILCLDVLEHVPDPPAVVAMLERCLRPGGFLIVSAPFFMIVPEFSTHLRANRRYSGSIRKLYGSHGLKLANGRFFLDPIVLAKPPLTAWRGWRGMLRRGCVRSGALLLSLARWWSWPHIEISRYLQWRSHPLALANVRLPRPSKRNVSVCA